MKTLVLALPGLNVQPEDFETHGFAAALRARTGAEMSMLALGPYDYLEADFPDRLAAEAVAPARRAGYARIALLALSAGALGALRFAACHGTAVDGLIFLAPFLANPGTIVEVERSGGFAGWAPPPPARSDIERPGLLWLKSYAAAGAIRPWLHLGFGIEDRFGAGARLLAAILPERAVTLRAGGHDWPTWITLWDAMLDRLPLR